MSEINVVKMEYLKNSKMAANNSCENVTRNNAHQGAFWSWHSVRLQMAFLLSFSMTVHGLMRGNLSMALVPYCESVQTDLQVYWDASSISFMHAAFYAGTFFAVLIAHKGSQMVGAKDIISYSVLTIFVCTWAVPFVVYFLPHYLFTSAIRFFMGFAQGFFIPCASLMIAKWYAESEKSTAMAIFTTGNQLGLSLAMFLTAELCKVPFLGGWPTSFFLYGLIGAVFLCVWCPLAADKPRDSKRITAVELAHIEGVGVKRLAISVISKTPYKQILLSPVVLSLNLCGFCQSFVLVSMISYLPEFNKAVLGLQLSANGKWSSLPFAIQVFSKVLFAFIADSMKTRGFSVNSVTKLFNGIACFGCGFCMLMVSISSDGSVILTFLCLGLSLTSGYVAGYYTSIVCVAPTYTAAISAYNQVFSQFASIIAPIIIGHVTQKSDINAWSLVFQILVVILLVSGLTFQLFGSANIQPWAQLGLTSFPPNSSNHMTPTDKQLDVSEEQKLLSDQGNLVNQQEMNTVLLLDEEVENSKSDSCRT
uniref:Major facilitator superfamily (MFS) profile domain-containing protein n=1 Tax=Ditylenchus dipsaci TaxID=166011 RepID=A0A915DD18_9BILA